jgi:hypothetical protein
MPPVDIDRQAIERRDFPIARRGYEPAAVDAHLRALAAEIEELQHERDGAGAGESSLASTAGTQVQSILAAAEAAAADIERQAREEAQATRERADSDAAETREQAIAQARAHVEAVAQATATLHERVGSMDGEVSALVESLRTGAGRLAADLAAVETNMGELYDAAAGKDVTRAVAGESQPLVPTPPVPAPAQPRADTATPGVHVDPETRGPGNGAKQDSSDLDGARLIALNMALNGESRADADRYLAENFQLADRGKLIDEVFAAIEA